MTEGLRIYHPLPIPANGGPLAGGTAGDLAELETRPLQRQMTTPGLADLPRHYLGLGVGGFRCRKPATVPALAWRPLIREAKALAPDVVFIADTVGMAEAEVLAL